MDCPVIRQRAPRFMAGRYHIIELGMDDATADAAPYMPR
jgi:hypothetical protein